MLDRNALLIVAATGLTLIATATRAQIVIEGRPVATKADFALPSGDGRYEEIAGRGIVYDSLLGIYWLKDASCDALGASGDGTGTYAQAQAAVAALAAGDDGIDCDDDGIADLNDRSEPGDWRLATLDEWMTTSAEALVLGCSMPAMLRDDGLGCYDDGAASAFEGLETTSLYWTSNADVVDPTQAMVFDPTDGGIFPFPKEFGPVIWPVRDAWREVGPQGDVVIRDRGAETREDGPCDGSLSLAAQRYVDCGNGTVLDLATGLLWVADPQCKGTVTWGLAMLLAFGLEDGDCGLTDGSQRGDWRLPSEEEWLATRERALALGCTTSGVGAPPTLTNTTGGGCLEAGPSPFTDELFDQYWSSTADLERAFVFGTALGGVAPLAKTGVYGVWAVRRR